MRRLLVGLLLLLVALVGTAIYGYSQLDVHSTKVESATIKFSFILAEGVEFSGRTVLHNGSKVPIYIPKAHHTLVINGQEISRQITTQGTWLSPGEESVTLFKLFIETAELPEATVRLLLARGKLDIVVRTRIGMGPFRTTLETESVVDLLQSIGEVLTAAIHQ